MSLLEEIQKEAVDSTSDLGTLLRKCKLLAARLGSQPLEDWLIWESNGYPINISVPNYRTWPLHIKGHFSGPFNSGLRNAEIPISCLPQETRENYKKYQCRQSIASMEQLLRGAEHNTLIVSTGDLAVVLGTNVYEGQNCMQAWAEFGTGHIYELFNIVRNKILDFSIAIWKEDATAGDSTKPLDSSLAPSRVTQIFNTSVYGGSANLLGTVNHSSVSFSVNQGDIQALENVLREKDVSQEDIDNLKTAIKEDEQPIKKGNFGPKVANWISGMIKRAAEGTWAITVSAAGNLLSQVISNYYGW
jgi:hypothetical protein